MLDRLFSLSFSIFLAITLIMIVLSPSMIVAYLAYITRPDIFRLDALLLYINIITNTFTISFLSTAISGFLLNLIFLGGESNDKQ